MAESNQTKIAVIQQKVISIEEKVNHIDQQVSDNYVTKDKYTALEGRVKMLEKSVYGLIGLIVVQVVGAVMFLVLK